MSIFTDEYKKLLIVQYADKPKAQQHIEALLKLLEDNYNLGNDLGLAFDVDLAIGKQLDILGKIVGLSRKVPFVIPKTYFGFSDNINAFGFGDKFLEVISKPMRDKFEIPYTDTELNDYDYRFFIKAKIIKNYTKATMIDDKNLSIQNGVDFLFNNKAYVTDGKNMTFNIYINKTYDFSIIRYLVQLDIIPRPQAVKYFLIKYVENQTFGFYEHNTTFGDKFDNQDDLTYFASKILI